MPPGGSMSKAFTPRKQEFDQRILFKNWGFRREGEYKVTK